MAVTSLWMRWWKVATGFDKPIRDAPGGKIAAFHVEYSAGGPSGSTRADIFATVRGTDGIERGAKEFAGVSFSTGRVDKNIFEVFFPTWTPQVDLRIFAVSNDGLLQSSLLSRLVRIETEPPPPAETKLIMGDLELTITKVTSTLPSAAIAFVRIRNKSLHKGVIHVFSEVRNTLGQSVFVGARDITIAPSQDFTYQFGALKLTGGSDYQWRMHAVRKEDNVPVIPVVTASFKTFKLPEPPTPCPGGCPAGQHCDGTKCVPDVTNGGFDFKAFWEKYKLYIILGGAGLGIAVAAAAASGAPSGSRIGTGAGGSYTYRAPKIRYSVT